MKRPRHQHLTLPILGCVLASLTICVADAATSSIDDVAVQHSEQQRKHKHHLLLFMGGLKSLAAVMLIKIKIVLVIAAIIAVVVFTIKHLLGATGLAEIGGLFYKGNSFVGPPPHHPPHHEPAPSYVPVVHETVYGHDYHTSIPWEQSSHETYGNHWSKVGDGGRSLLDIAQLYPTLGDVLLQNYFNHRKRVKRKNNLYRNLSVSSRK